MPNEITDVLVLDETAVERKFLSEVLAAFPSVHVAGTASNGNLAARKLETLPCQLVLLGGGGDGALEALETLHQQRPGIPIAVVGGDATDARNVAARAHQLGAIDVLHRPHNHGEEELEAFGRALNSLLRRLSSKATPPAKVAPATAPAQPQPPTPVAPAPAPKIAVAPPRLFGAILIGISTGGPPALLEMIPDLSRSLALPVLLVQHMPPGFTAPLAETLARRARIPVREATDGELIRPGEILVAPGGRHMVVRKRGSDRVVALIDDDPVKGCRPSVDVLFSSAVGMWDKPILTVVMTGMGNDGVDGVRMLSQHGSYNLVQNESTSVVYGMPRAVADAGLAHEVLTLDAIASRINTLTVRESACA